MKKLALTSYDMKCNAGVPYVVLGSRAEDGGLDESDARCLCFSEAAKIEDHCRILNLAHRVGHCENACINHCWL